MHKTPLVSIIIPTYNRAHLIGETLESVMAQTYVNWECIVIDDGSTDNTSEILKLYCEKDNRIQYHQRPEYHKPGGNGARNYGFELSRGEYVNWLDSDDFFSNDKLKEQIRQVNTFEDVDIVTCSWGKATAVNDFQIKKLNIYKDYKEGINLLRDYGVFKEYFVTHNFLVKRELVNKTGLWNERLLINQDGEFFARILIMSGKIVFSKKAYVLYREPNSDNTSFFSNKLKAEQAIVSWELISGYLKLVDKSYFKAYIRYSKENIYKRIYSSYPSLIKEYECFFYDIIAEKSFIKKVKQKLKRKFLCKF
ncbi:glycosyltransferase family A protein [Mesoflavibacter sp. SCSIO 43206]|uniref:glycosyltransferase family 2 protein n=1 Tax=Mesoflavibacter sp. SCSIO 43206 TaxID=2779362 RepID=UPI001CA8ADB2|nr:glycosyltransferase family A protein [Mesoflavibacter sp. SCSIO 43206]UAB74711.1 glycosyltransferase family 2 protein [Mesoflavibacter sp. SCSIO 43206]